MNQEQLSQDNSIKILRMLLTELEMRYGIKPAELLSRIVEPAEGLPQDSLPISIFSGNDLGPLESVVKYLKENMKMRHKDIAALLGRNPRAIWNSYRQASRKSKEPYSSLHGPYVPVSIFGSREMSVLEHLTAYLKEKEGLHFCEIARLLNRDYRTVWTAYNRGVRKVAAR